MTNCVLPSAKVGRLPNVMLPNAVLVENSTGLKEIGAPLGSRKAAITATGGSGFASLVTARLKDHQLKMRPTSRETDGSGAVASICAPPELAGAELVSTVFHSAVSTAGL